MQCTRFALMETKSLKALILLLEDPDEAIFEQIRTAIINEGLAAIPYLEESWENSNFGPDYRKKIEDLVHHIQFTHIQEELVNWLNSPDKDLMEGALIVARYHYPDLDTKAVYQELENIKKAIWLEISDHRTAYEQIRIFNKVFFGKLGFKGAGSDYYSPLNSYLNCVLDSKKGNPLSLSIIYSTIAQQLGLPIYGVNLPNHFILAYLDRNDILSQFKEGENYGILFYINPYSKGSIFEREEIDSFLDNLGREHERSYYEPCSNSTIIHRMITNLIIAYEQEERRDKANELRQLRDLFDFKV